MSVARRIFAAMIFIKTITASQKPLWPLVIGWTMVGLLTYLLALSIPQGVSWMDYILPPLLVGLPMAMLEDRVLRLRLKRVEFLPAMFIRVVLYAGAITITYFLIGQHAYHWSDYHLGRYVVHFLLLWGATSLILLMLRNVLGHFDQKSLMNWGMGGYHQPTTQFRRFLFVDLNFSTAIAERIGHQAYFEFLSEFFSIAGNVVADYGGEVYQYVGDEVIISWGGQHNETTPVEMFFALQDRLMEKEALFMKKWGALPRIKASLHSGCVTRGEISGRKREFVYTGDVLNAASRMQSFCTLETPLVASSDALSGVQINDRLEVEDLGEHAVRGKSTPIGVIGLKRRTPVM